MTMPRHRNTKARAVAKAASATEADTRLILFGATVILSSLLLLDRLLDAGRLVGP